MKNGSCLLNTLLAVSITFHKAHRPTVLALLFNVLLLPLSLSGQYWMEINSPTQASPCVDYPIEITLYNDAGEATQPSLFTLTLPDGFS